MPFHLFSNPHEGDFVTLAEDLSLRLFRKMHARVNTLAAEGGAPEVRIDLAGWTAPRMGTRGWLPELGAVRMGIHAGVRPDDLSWLTGQFTLAAYLMELLPSVDLEIAGRHPVTLAGHFLRGPRLRFQGTATRLTVLDASGTVVLSLQKVVFDGMAPVWARDPERDIVRVGSGAVAVLTDAEWMTYWNTDSPKDPLAHDIPAQKRQVEETLAFMEQHLPLQYLWVSLLMREVVPLIDAGPQRTRSQSFLLWPGQVQLSETSRLQTISLLMHECTHQYFNMLLWFGRVVKAGAPDAYSVLKGRNRPLERILLGFHAFANILLVYSTLRSSPGPIPPKDIEDQLRNLRPIVSDLDGVLLQNWEQHLEQMGRELYLPLRERLVAVDLLPVSGAVKQTG
ncbi:HEXXH motif-containing putative peptide modification protein [Corallococcus interemptor]|uniref:aKG-HExxH-type peptide beta-hydroxylase n=1 Tax=Corallococcus TaxID=83461 RepID=UPI0035D454D9